jgi:hypothetical protein
MAMALPMRAAAQTPPPPSAADDTAKSAVFVFASALRGAVLLGGQKLAQQASTVVPELVLAPSEQPTVRGVKLDGWGFFFDVQIPEIWNSTMMVWDMYNQLRRTRGEAPPQGASGPAQPVSERPTVAAAGPVEPDPMTSELATQGGRDRAYSSYVRGALIDALLDSSAVLPLGPTDRLTIAASGIDQPGSNPLYQERKLILTIKASDLQDLRQGRITREEAKARVSEGRF